jgi:MSHA pilin protein MshC
MDEDYSEVMEIMKKSEAVSPPANVAETVRKAEHSSQGKEIRQKKTTAAMRGFTMIEVVVVLLVIGVLSAFAMSKYSSTATYSLKSQTEVIKNHLRYAQTRAMNSNDYWGINFAGSSYTFFSSTNPSTPVMLPGEDSSVATIPYGITTTTGIVVFDTWGKPYTDAAGASIQTGNRNIIVSLTGEPSETITITENTGFVP